MPRSQPLRFDIHKVKSTGTTNLDVCRVAMDNGSEGYVLVADKQNSGVGRHGRTWESPEGNLYCSVLLRPRCHIQDVGLYSFVVSLAVYETLRPLVHTSEIQLKWPNDVLVDGKKISGILIDAAPVYDQNVEWIVIGVGINIRHHPASTGSLYQATSLAGEGVGVSVDQVLSSYLEALSKWWNIQQTQGFLSVRKAWIERALKGQLTVRLPHETITGTFQDIDPHGYLILRLADGLERRIATGDVFAR